LKSVLYIQYTNPTGYPPLDHSSRILADAGWSVNLFGIHSRGDSNALVFEPHKNRELRLMPYCEPGLKQKLHYLRFWAKSIGRCLATRAQVVYASDAWSYPVGYSLSLIPGISVIMHEHDSPNVTTGQVNRLIGWFRKRLAKRAMMTICPQPDRAAKMIHEIGPRKMQVVFNCPRKQETRQPPNRSKEELRLWFHGSIVPTQLPECIIDAMQLCDFPVRLDFAGYETIGHGGYVQHLLRRANECGLEGRVQYLGAIPSRGAMLEKASKCDIGLTLFAKNFREPMTGASNKPFDYLACGLALLVPDTDEWNGFFVKPGCGLSCDSEQPQSVAKAISWCWNHRDELAEMNAKGRALLQEKWNYEVQFQPVLDAMESLVAK
jgi:glycosyltransferase involved in cell wall biosynthesis